MKILFCISDHGYGHAARSIPIIQKLLAKGHDVVVRNTSAAKMLALEVPLVQIIAERNDVGVLQVPGSYAIDHQATRQALDTWMGELAQDKKRIAEHIKMHAIDLLITDSSPQGLFVAKENGIPGVFVGSFTWIDVYEHLLLLDPSEKSILMMMYGAASLSFALPFSSALKGIVNRQDVDLVVRRPTCMIPPIPHSVLYSVSGSMNGTPAWHAKNFTGKMVISANVEPSPVQDPIKMGWDIPSIEYTNAVSLVVARSGYGIVAECIACKKPVYLVRRPGFIDDDTVIQEVTRLGIGREVSPDELCGLVTDEIFTDAALLQKAYNSLPDQYLGDGAEQIVHAVESLIAMNQIQEKEIG